MKQFLKVMKILMAWYKPFVPDLTVAAFTELKLEDLKKLGCQVLLCDIDNTLIPYDQKLPDENVYRFVDELGKADIKVILISNNTKERVSIFAEDLRLAYYGNAYKPLKGIYKRILKDIEFDKNQVVCMGDQLLTDVWGAHRAGLKVVWSRPLVKRDLFYTRFNRLFESFIYKTLLKKGCLNEKV